MIDEDLEGGGVEAVVRLRSTLESIEDLPDDEERWRNSLIETLQGTRNPFIDYPEVVSLIRQ